MPLLINQIKHVITMKAFKGRTYNQTIPNN